MKTLSLSVVGALCVSVAAQGQPLDLGLGTKKVLKKKEAYYDSLSLEEAAAGAGKTASSAGGASGAGAGAASSGAAASGAAAAAGAGLSIPAVGALVVAGAGIAGGGGAPAPSPAPSSEYVTSDTLVSAAPNPREAIARTYQPWLTQINKPYANQLGAGAGAGVTVGVIDSGAQVSHPVLSGVSVTTYNAFNLSSDVSDLDGHGTHVAGILAGQASIGPTEGVATEASLAIAKVFEPGNPATGTERVVSRGINWAVNTQSVPILSLSLGGRAPVLEASLQNAVNKDVLIVAAMGNGGNPTASWPAKFASEGWAQGKIIAVGAVDKNNLRASFSNYDASLANWTVYAPGVDIASSTSIPANNYAYMSGTSMATPMVSGQAALLKSNWNFLTANNLANIIFESATRLCSDGASGASCTSRQTPDSVYGWGLINVGASLQPLGQLVVTTGSGQKLIQYSGSKLASQQGGLVAGLPAVKTIATDKYNRGFVVNVGTSLTAVQGVTALPSAGLSTAGSSSTKLAFQYQPQTHFGQDAKPILARMSLRQSFGASSEVAMGMGSTHISFFGLQASKKDSLSLTDVAKFNAPYFQLVSDATHGGYAHRLNAATTIKVGWVSQGKPLPANPLEQQPEATALTSKSSSIVEVEHVTGKLTNVLTLGQLNETNSILGLHGSGALSTGSGAKTDFVTLASSLDLSDTLSLAAMGSLGTTQDVSNRSSLLDGVQNLKSSGWSLGLFQSEVWARNDRLGISVSSPMRAMSGDMLITTATSQSQLDGSLQYSQARYSLVPSGMERNWELSYTRELKPIKSKLQFLGQVKTQPGHEAAAQSLYGVGVRLTTEF